LGKTAYFHLVKQHRDSLFGVNDLLGTRTAPLVGAGVVWLVSKLARIISKSSAMGLFFSQYLKRHCLFHHLKRAVMTTPLCLFHRLSMNRFWQAWENKARLWGYLFFMD